jgi:hypothetical protein
MSWLIGTLLVLFAIAGGGWGWWKGTRALANPPDFLDRPMGIGRREFERRLYKRYRRRRILLIIGGSLGGAIGGFALLLAASFLVKRR